MPGPAFSIRRSHADSASRRVASGGLRLAVVCLGLGLSLVACVQKMPPELLEAVETLDRELTAIQGAEFAPEEYARFVEHWASFKGRLSVDEDLIHWPWETNPLLADLHKVHEEGLRAASAASQRREAERVKAEGRLTALEDRLKLFTSSLDGMGGRVVLGQRPVETELLARQARSFFEQGFYSRSLRTAEQASDLLDDQIARLSAELGRYADARRVVGWRRMVRHTVDWSRAHHAPAIVISKADRRLTLYRNGRPVVSYSIGLGYNGILEKRYQGDGATPEGQYRIIRKRDRGQTKFYRALLLDYPNAEDRRRFTRARVAGSIPTSSFIGGQIEIHGGDDESLVQTLGCVMLENRQIDRLFEAVEVGTPVTIVGATEVANAVSTALAELAQSVES
ncbi:MAG: L,D-transpeptidase [Nitrospirota bacterium]